MTTGEGEALACRRCGEQLAVSRAERSPVTYYRCNCCGTTVTSADTAALRAVARSVADEAEQRASDSEFREWQRRMDAFTVRADQTNPFQRLGLSPDATLGEARDRFHALAMAQHPDRGGDAEVLGEIVDAFDRIRDRFTERLRHEQKARATASSESATQRPKGVSILPRRRPESWSRWTPQGETALAKRRT